MATFCSWIVMRPIGSGTSEAVRPPTPERTVRLWSSILLLCQRTLMRCIS
jgi:hypothetical protein